MALDSFENVRDWMLVRAGELADSTSDFNTFCTNAIVARWRELWTLWPWLELRKYPPGVILTVAPVTNLTITVTAGSTSLTLSAASATDLDNYVIIPDGKDYMLRVTAHTAASASVTIDAAPETLTTQACTITKIEYDLPTNCGVIVENFWADDTPVPLKSEEHLRRTYGERPEESWPPECIARISGTKVRLSSYSTARERIEVPFIEELSDPSGTGTLGIPAYLRPVLAEGALSILYERKSDKRQPLAEARWEKGLSRAKNYQTLMVLGTGSAAGAAQPGPYAD